MGRNVAVRVQLTSRNIPKLGSINWGKVTQNGLLDMQMHTFMNVSCMDEWIDGWTDG